MKDQYFSADIFQEPLLNFVDVADKSFFLHHKVDQITMFTKKYTDIRTEIDSVQRHPILSKTS